MQTDSLSFPRQNFPGLLLEALGCSLNINILEGKLSQNTDQKPWKGPLSSECVRVSLKGLGRLSDKEDISACC